MRAAGTRHSGRPGPIKSPSQSIFSNSSHVTPRTTTGRTLVSASRREASFVTGVGRDQYAAQIVQIYKRRLLRLLGEGFQRLGDDRGRIGRGNALGYRVAEDDRYSLSQPAGRLDRTPALDLAQRRQHGRRIDVVQRPAAQVGETPRFMLMMTSVACTGAQRGTCNACQVRVTYSKKAWRRAPDGSTWSRS